MRLSLTLFAAHASCLTATHGVRLWDSLKSWCNLDDDAKVKVSRKKRVVLAAGRLQAEADRFEQEVLKGGVVALPGVQKLLSEVKDRALRVLRLPRRPFCCTDPCRVNLDVPGLDYCNKRCVLSSFPSSHRPLNY